MFIFVTPKDGNPEEKKVGINTLHIMTFHDYKGYTRIVMNSAYPKPFILVRESFDDVVSLIKNVSGR